MFNHNHNYYLIMVHLRDDKTRGVIIHFRIHNPKEMKLDAVPCLINKQYLTLSRITVRRNYPRETLQSICSEDQARKSLFY
jgi:hypothetical protein